MDIEQRSPEWYEARLGKATASRFKDILAKIGRGEAAARRNYRAQLVVERITGQQAERFTSSYMEWGTETEDLARITYELRSGNRVEQVGFIEHPDIAAGASPDGLIGKDGALEIKCMNTANHIDVLRNQSVLPEYIPQIQGQLWITRRKWCDFVSFEPTMPANAQIFIERVYRDDAFIKNLLVETSLFLHEVDDDMKFLLNYKAPAPAKKKAKALA